MIRTRCFSAVRSNPHSEELKPTGRGVQESRTSPLFRPFAAVCGVGEEWGRKGLGRRNPRGSASRGPSL